MGENSSDEKLILESNIEVFLPGYNLLKQEVKVHQLIPCLLKIYLKYVLGRENEKEKKDLERAQWNT